jgi:hypothetical protein
MRSVGVTVLGFVGLAALGGMGYAASFAVPTGDTNIDVAIRPMVGILMILVALLMAGVVYLCGYVMMTFYEWVCKKLVERRVAKIKESRPEIVKLVNVIPLSKVAEILTVIVANNRMLPPLHGLHPELDDVLEALLSKK